MRIRDLIILSIFACVCIPLHAEDVVSTSQRDTTQKADKFKLSNVLKWPVLGVVYPTLSPETGIAIGVGIQGVWNMPNEKTPSSMRLTGCYTQFNQWRIQTAGTLYWAGKHPWMLKSTIQYRDYPDKYYGIGNVENEPVKYGSKRFNFTLEPLFRLPKDWSVGPMVDFLWEKVAMPDSIYKGRYTTTMWGLGISSQYDTRDGIYYPTRGLLLSMKGFYCEPALGSDCRLWKLDLDFRHFIRLWEPKNSENDFQRVNGSLIFAYQLRLQAALTGGATNNIPFQMLPTLGGDEILRGIHTNMFRDNTLWALQTELRYPIYRIIHGTAFASMGDVYNTENWHWGVPKIGYGLGLRVTINRAHVNVRFDVARNNIDKDWSRLGSYSFYITASEAF